MENVEFKEWLVLNEARYGNYCGPGPKLNKDCSALANGEPFPTPINNIDAICQNHDISYCRCKANWKDAVLSQPGTPCSRGADKIMQGDIETIIPKLSGSEKFYAKLMLTYFKSHEKIQNFQKPPQPPFALA